MDEFSQTGKVKETLRTFLFVCFCFCSKTIKLNSFRREKNVIKIHKSILKIFIKEDNIYNLRGSPNTSELFTISLLTNGTLYFYLSQL